MESCNIFIPLLSAWTEYSDTYCSLIYKIENNEDHCMSVVILLSKTKNNYKRSLYIIHL